MKEIKKDEQDAVEFLKLNKLFENGSDYSLTLLAKKMSLYKVKKGDPVFLEGEDSKNLFFVRSGVVDITKSRNDRGEIQFIRTIKPYEVFSEYSTLTNRPHSTSAFAKEDSEVYKLPGDVFLEIVTENSDIAKSLVRYISRHYQATMSSGFFVRPFKTEDLNFSEDIIKHLPIENITKYKAMPVRFENKTLHVALCLPFNNDFFKDFEKRKSGINLQLYTIQETEFETLRKPIMNAYLGRESTVSLHNKPQFKSDHSTIQEFLNFSLAYSQLPTETLEQLTETAELKKFKPGEVIVQENSPLDYHFIVKSGLVDLTKQVGEHPLACHVETLGTYDSFGEVSIVSNSWMALRATAKTECELLMVSKAHFLKFIENSHFAYPMAIHLAGRLGTLNSLPGVQLNLDNETQLTSMTEITVLNDLLSEQNSNRMELDTSDIDKLLGEILAHSVKERTSDIHIEPFENNTVVRCRIDGVLAQPFHPIPLEVGERLLNRVKVLANNDITEKRFPQDGQFSTKVDDRTFAGRVSTVPTKYGEKLCIRLLKKQDTIIPLNQLAQDKQVIRFLNGLTKYRQGLFLIAGPTGSGKTSTLYSILSQMNRQKYNIVTLEDPIELEFAGVNQIQLNNEIGLNYNVLLRSVMRQDPDIILVGEIRDAESLKLVFDASLTGHLVLATIHASTAIDVVPRLLELGATREQIMTSLIGVLSQRLVRSNCPSCSEKFPVTGRETDIFKKVLGNSKVPTHIKQGRGCSKCHFTGFYGRLPLFEFWQRNEDVSAALTAGKDLAEFVECVKSSKDYTGLTEYGIHMAGRGFTTLDEVESLLFGLSDIFNDELVPDKKKDAA